MTVKEFGLTDNVMESLAQCFSRNTNEIKVCCYHSMKTGRSVSFRPAVSHLLCAGFTEI